MIRERMHSHWAATSAAGRHTTTSHRFRAYRSTHLLLDKHIVFFLAAFQVFFLGLHSFSNHSLFLLLTAGLCLEGSGHLHLPLFVHGFVLISALFSSGQLATQGLGLVFIPGIFHLCNKFILFQFHFSVKRFKFLFFHFIQLLPLFSIFGFETATYGESR